MLKPEEILIRDAEIIDDYLNKVMSKKEIATKHNMSEYNVSRILKKNNAKRGKLYMNTKFTPWNKGVNKDNSEIYKKMSEDRTGEGNPRHGEIPWNKGKTKNTDERLAKIAEKASSREMKEETKEKLRKAKLGKRAEQTNNWKGGNRTGYNGYKIDNDSIFRQYSHRKIAIEILGYEEVAGKHIHHIDMNKANNSPENLIVLNNRNHLQLHAYMRKNPEKCDRESQVEFLKINNYEYRVLK